MLVLSRKPGETITITLPNDPEQLQQLLGAEITLTVVRLGPSTARIGTEAPTSCTIHRTEIIGTPADKPLAFSTVSGLCGVCNGDKRIRVVRGGIPVYVPCRSCLGESCLVSPK